jgi:uncharacterized membrane protein
MEKGKRSWLITIGIVEAAVIIFCLVVSIIVLVTNTEANQTNLDKNGVFIGSLQNNPTLFFCCFVLPLFIIFVADGVYLIFYVTKKESVISDEEKEAIAAEARRQAREEVMKALQGKEADKPKDEKK